MSKRKVIATVCGVGVAATIFTGCVTQKAKEPYRDAPVAERGIVPSTGNLEGVETYTNADGFSNWGEGCDKHGNRVFITFHGDGAYAAIAAVRDPSCPGYRAQ